METETIGRDLLECIVPLFLLLAEPTGAVYVRNLQLLLQHFHSQLSSFYLLVSLNLRHLTASHLEVAVQGEELAFSLRLSSDRASTRRRWQLRDRK